MTGQAVTCRSPEVAIDPRLIRQVTEAVYGPHFPLDPANIRMVSAIPPRHAGVLIEPLAGRCETCGNLRHLCGGKRTPNRDAIEVEGYDTLPKTGKVGCFQLYRLYWMREAYSPLVYTKLGDSRKQLGSEFYCGRRRQHKPELGSFVVAEDRHFAIVSVDAGPLLVGIFANHSHSPYDSADNLAAVNIQSCGK